MEQINWPTIVALSAIIVPGIISLYIFSRQRSKTEGELAEIYQRIAREEIQARNEMEDRLTTKIGYLQMLIISLSNQVLLLGGVPITVVDDNEPKG